MHHTVPVISSAEQHQQQVCVLTSDGPGPVARLAGAQEGARGQD